MSPDTSDILVPVPLGELAELSDAICWLDGHREFSEADRDQAKVFIARAHEIIESRAGAFAQEIYGKEEGAAA